MNKYMILGMGSPSDKKAFERQYFSLDQMTIPQYLNSRGIQILKRDIGDLKVSCHRTPERVAAYAEEAEILSGNPKGEQNRVVAVLFGGMSLALPGMFSSYTQTVPVIGVPARSSSTHGGDIDAPTAVYNLPPGTVVGGAPMHDEKEGNLSLDKAVRIAEAILNADSPDITYIGPSAGDSFTQKIYEQINPKGTAESDIQGYFSIPHTHKTICTRVDNLELALGVTDDPADIVRLDEQSGLALQCQKPAGGNRKMRIMAFADTLDALDATQNTLYFAKPGNVGLFLARIAGMYDEDIRQKLIKKGEEKKEETAEKYGDKVPLVPENFE